MGENAMNEQERKIEPMRMNANEWTHGERIGMNQNEIESNGKHAMKWNEMKRYESE
jgi:hypothetical protein